MMLAIDQLKGCAMGDRRRPLVSAGLALVPSAPLLAQSAHPQHAGQCERLSEPGRIDRPCHQVYDPAADRWSVAAPVPRGANHIGVEALDGRLYAIGDAIYVAGGGPVMGGGMQSAVHEAFTLD